ncbi:MarR family transcriptional regulator [Halobacteriales archaeon QS_3_64_16]|nr:MAG: MarR family transcriptional regulator [Halobacteriales archaeon QS_3_64_16]
MTSSGQEDVDPVELGVELLRKFEGGELSVAAAVDRVETITTNPAVTRAVLDEAERRGVLEREEGVFQARGEGFVRHESEVISREGEFTCRRCRAALSTGYFLQLEAGEHGPFGSSCIRKVTGRERE